MLIHIMRAALEANRDHHCTITVPSLHHHCNSGTVFLRTGVILTIDKTAVLKASMNATLYPQDPFWPGNAALVVG